MNKIEKDIPRYVEDIIKAYLYNLEALKSARPEWMRKRADYNTNNSYTRI